MGRCDMFFTAVGAKSGKISGESNDKVFPDQIELVEWKWGMTAPTAVGGGQRIGRTLLHDIKLVKRADRASTGLANVMYNNEILNTAELSVRKAGGPASALAYLVVRLKLARITSYEVESDIGDEGEQTLTERLTLTFKKIEIEHKAQSGDGGGGGGSLFTGEVNPQA